MPRSRRLWLVLVVAGILLGIVVGVGIGWWVGTRTPLLSRACLPLEAVDLDVPEIVGLKDRWKTYVRSPDPDAHLVLSMREATFLLAAESNVGLVLEGEGERVRATVTIPAEGGCYNVRYFGGMQVHDGLAILDPEELKIGSTDLSQLSGLGGALGRTRPSVSPEDLENPRLRELLANIEDLSIEDGQVRVRFIDPSLVWR